MTMRDVFRAYYAPAGQELDALWTEGIIVLDTNTLLNFFRYTETTREDFFRVLESFADSLWLPYQVGLEFQQSRLAVINGTAEAFEKVRGAAATARNALHASLDAYKHHPTLDRSHLTSEVDRLFTEFEATITSNQNRHNQSLRGKSDPERTFSRISDLFEGRVGQGFTTEELVAIREEGAVRYEKQIPPGFKDSGKSSGDEFGDLIVWKELLRHAEAAQKPVIFVTGDVKDDWWRREQGRTQGPRPELVDEFWSQVQRRIHFYEPLQFLRFATERRQVSVSDRSFDEVEEVATEGERIRSILLRRRRELLRQSRMHRRELDRQRRMLPSDEQRAELISELSMIDEAQRKLGSDQRALAESISELFQLNAIEEGGVSGDHIAILRKQMDEQAAMERRYATLKERRAEIEEGLMAAHPPRDPRMAERLEGRRLRAEDELHQVELALQELDD
jgi:hypothetical protein